MTQLLLGTTRVQRTLLAYLFQSFAKKACFSQLFFWILFTSKIYYLVECPLTGCSNATTTVSALFQSSVVFKTTFYAVRSAPYAVSLLLLHSRAESFTRSRSSTRSAASVCVQIFSPLICCPFVLYVSPSSSCTDY